jgi:phosphatidylethanolamine/phosphatidyl-N-methylethanolamine N-methyltransferase
MTLSRFQQEHFAAHPRVTTRPVVAGGNAFIDAVYARLSPVYDVIFGAPLQPGRIAAVRQMGIRPGDRVLEVGAGTGINVPLYPRHCRVTAIDLSAPMLERARRRISRQGIAHVELLEQDAARMTFPDDFFDSVYAPYVMSVVVDPICVVREMRRVCRPGGRIVILNHFRSTNPVLSRLERAISPLTVHVGFRLDLALTELLRRADLWPASVEKVNFPPMWSLVTCIKN